jgi:hypothetical protein
MAMIHEVDESLRALIARDVVQGSGVEVAFDSPTKDWAARRNHPTLNLYLYQIQEDTKRRDVAYAQVRDSSGRVTERRSPPRQFALSYLVTAWTQRPEDEHRLLSSVLSCFLRFAVLPTDILVGTLVDETLSVTIALPPPTDRHLTELWSALGGELKPALDLVVTAPMAAGGSWPAGPPVQEQPRVRVVGRPGPSEDTGTRARRTSTPPQSGAASRAAPRKRNA